MRLPAAVAAALLTLPLALAGCSHTDVAACERAMRAALSRVSAESAAGQPMTPQTRPSECDGVDDATLQQLAAKVLSEQFGSSSPAPTP
jgi:hypothetical protein